VTARRIAVALAAGTVLRLALAWHPTLWPDEATSGLMALAVLRGELPVYFFGQPFMGALDAYLTAPFLAVFGVSGRTLESVAVLASVLWAALTVRLAWEGFGRRAALVAALLLALPPDYLLQWSHEARPHYQLAMALGTLALLLALRLSPVAPVSVRLGVLGAILGLAFWTNFLSLVFVPAAALLVVWRIGLRRLPAMVAAVPGFALGSLPHWLYGLRHGTALPPPGDRIEAVELLRHVQFLGEAAWPILAGVPGPLRGTTAGTLLALFLATGYVVAAVGGLRALRATAREARATQCALLLLAGTNLGVAVGTHYGRFLEDDARHLLPLYTVLPVLVGHGLTRLRSRRLAMALTVAVLIVHGAGVAASPFQVFRPGTIVQARAQARADRETIAALEQGGFHRLYAPDAAARVLGFLSAERVVFSNHYEEPYPRYALLVDGAESAGWWVEGRLTAFEATLRALGARFAFRPSGPLGGVYTDFVVRAAAVRELDAAALTVTASEGGRFTGRMTDGDARTFWRTAGPMRGGEWIEVDLGRPERVALVRWLPAKHQEVPRGLTLETSLDGERWERRLEVPSYFGPLYWSAGRPMGRVRNGRVELRVDPVPARYLRITQTGRDTLWAWSIRELFVYALADGPGDPAPTADGRTLARAVREAGATRLYADHGWGSRVALADPGIRVLPANYTLDAYGFVGPPAAFLTRLDWAPGSGVVLEPVDAEAFTRRAGAAGLGVIRRDVAGLVLFAHASPPPTPGAPLAASLLRVTASRRPDEAPHAVDGDPATRWGTGRPQAPGDWVQVELDTPRPVRAVRVWTAFATDWPRGLRLEGTEDGVTWRLIPVEARTEGRLIWGGIALLRDGVEAVRLDFEPVALRALRLTLTRGDGVFDWSIHELTVFGAGDGRSG
jgi:4-amino-4-deoxy-L-arabinose transferase-like glycosyltransferase